MPTYVSSIVRQKRIMVINEVDVIVSRERSKNITGLVANRRRSGPSATSF
jgi:hypothetical protein